jgi:hypothetical protein
MKHNDVSPLLAMCEMSKITFFYANETGHDKIGSLHPK